MLPYLACLLATCTQQSTTAQTTKEQPVATSSVDLTKPGQMADIISNALLSLGRYEESKIARFLDNADVDYASGNALLIASAKEFKIDQKELAGLVQKFKHVNDGNMPSPDGSARQPESASRSNAKVTPFAENVVLHVVLHELGHALVREFDLPILGNEETLADSFATVYLTRYMPEQAPAVLEARVRSLMFEASEVPRAEWEVQGEHNNDARRAAQIAALAVAADAEKYKGVAAAAGLSERAIRNARDYGTEVHRSWRRILRPLQMPTGEMSREARVRLEGSIGSQLASRPIAKHFNTILRSFDWHSTVTISFVDGDGGAGWSRSRRTVTVNSVYVERFIRQGQEISKTAAKPK